MGAACGAAGHVGAVGPALPKTSLVQRRAKGSSGRAQEGNGTGTLEKVHLSRKFRKAFTTENKDMRW